MDRFFIMEIHTGSYINGAVSPDVFTRALQTNWSSTAIRATTDPRNPYILEWQAESGEGTICGRLGRHLCQCSFEGPLLAAAKFAVFYRELVPQDIRIHLQRIGGNGLELTRTTTPEEIQQALAEPHKRTQRRPAALSWWLMPGGQVPLSAQTPGGNAMFRTPDGNLWVQGLKISTCSLVTGQWEETPVPAAMQDSYFQVFAWFRNQLWTAGPRGRLMRYVDGQWQAAPSYPDLDDIYSPLLSVDQAGYLWLGTQNGLWRTVDGIAWEHVRILEPDHHISSLWSDRPGSLWVAEITSKPRWHASIHHLDNGQWTTLPPPPTARGFNGSIQALITDAAGNLWVGLADRGVWKWDSRTWQRCPVSFTYGKPGIPGYGIRGLYVDQHQRVWAVTRSGIGCFHDGVWRSVMIGLDAPSHEGVLPMWGGFTTVVSLTTCHADAEGRLWIGDRYAGVFWINTAEEPYANPLAYRLVQQSAHNGEWYLAVFQGAS